MLRYASTTKGSTGYSIIEGTKECLERLQMDYVDVVFAHRADNTGNDDPLPVNDITLNFTTFIQFLWKKLFVHSIMSLNKDG